MSVVDLAKLKSAKQLAAAYPDQLKSDNNIYQICHWHRQELLDLGILFKTRAGRLLINEEKFVPWFLGMDSTESVGGAA